jgi:hypothetical protein
MTIKQLKEKLAGFDENKDVILVFPVNGVITGYLLNHADGGPTGNLHLETYARKPVYEADWS